MKMRNLAVLLVMCLASLAVCFASASPQMGTWKLNEAKSKFSEKATKNNTVMYEAAGDQVKVTVDGVDADGKAIHSEWTGKFDGKDYPLMGDPSGDMRSYKQISANKLELTTKKDGKVTSSGTIVVSADGKTRTVTINGTDSMGKKVHYMAAYDKQ
jgi:hypothetical protein